MKTTPMRHQTEALRWMNGREEFALFMEQGTGKTWTLLADVENRYRAGDIDGMLVVAPNGVHMNWCLREIPSHLEVPHVAAAWRSSAGKRARAALEAAVLRPRAEDEVPPLRVLAISYDALCTKDGLNAAQRFLRVTRAMIVLDESHHIKNPSALRTKRCAALRPHARLARIATGTPVSNGPLDVFSPMDFLRPGLIGTTSYRAFVAEYSELMSADSPMMRALAQRNPKAAHAQIVARNPDGTPRWRNLERLQARLDPHSFRVLKRECLDLPEKIYTQHIFELQPEVRAEYDRMEETWRLREEDGTETPVTRLHSMLLLQQISSGFVTVDGEPRQLIRTREPSARLSALMEVLENVSGPFIVWARFREELRQVHAALLAAGISAEQYHGGTPQTDRTRIIDSFQRGELRAFVGQPRAGGTGITLTAAETVIYYSNDFSLVTRQQSEDRAHRIGTRRNVLYVDLIAEDSIDEAIVGALRNKEDLAARVLRDRGRGVAARRATQREFSGTSQKGTDQ